MIRVEHLSYRYDMNLESVLRDINMDIKGGEYVAIIGPNGSGKNTLLKHLNGLLTPTTGDVWVDRLNTKDTKSVQEIRQKVGMVFQNPDNQIVGMSVEEDVAFGPENLCLPSLEIRERVESSLEKVGIRKYAKRAPHTLSSGEKQLVAIAGVLAMKPEYIALDEPTTYLDPLGRKRVLDVIKGLNKQGITIIHVTQDMDEIVPSNRVVVMNKGTIILDENPAGVFTKPDLMKELGLAAPKITELIRQLIQMGTDIRPDILTLEEACVELSSLIRAKSS
ncbi:MAG: energy-coupling factor transporter ATPase [Pseudomonadota bacterium]